MRCLMSLVVLALVLQTGAAVLGQGPNANGQTPPNSADRLLFWVGAREVLELTDGDLERWKGRGVGGFICSARHLKGLGGTQDYTGDPAADLSGKQYELQRRFRDSQVVRRAKARGMKMYLGCYLVNYYNTATPLKEWFDDAGWSDVVLPRVREFAAAARLLGFDGIAFDQELYPQTGRVTTATWDWDYPQNTHTQAEVRAKAKQRGREMMAAILKGFPQVEIVVYHYQFPGTWQGVVQERVNRIANSGESALFVDFWDGLSGVEGYRAIRFINALFYKGPHVGTWDAALQYEYNSFYSLLSRRLSNWSYASSRVYESPFGWIDRGPSPSAYDDARPPEFVAAQLAAFKKWGMGGECAVFAYRPISDFDYTPYVDAMRSASQPAVVDAEPPRLEITTPVAPSDGASLKPISAETIDVQGSAVDNLAIRAVRWKNGRGGEGTAELSWKIISGDHRSGYDWRMDWSIRGIPLELGANRITVTVEDIKGLTTARTLTVERQSSGGKSSR